MNLNRLVPVLLHGTDPLVAFAQANNAHMVLDSQSSTFTNDSDAAASVGDNLKRWHDVSGNGNDATSSGSAMPLLSADGVSFTTDDFMSFDGTPIANTTFVAAAVFSCDDLSVQNRNYAIGGRPAATGATLVLGWNLTNDARMAYFGSHLTLVVPNVEGQMFMMVGIQSSTGRELRVTPFAEGASTSTITDSHTTFLTDYQNATIGSSNLFSTTTMAHASLWPFGVSVSELESLLSEMHGV